jgi:hypothetical protein
MSFVLHIESAGLSSTTLPERLESLFNQRLDQLTRCRSAITFTITSTCTMFTTFLHDGNDAPTMHRASADAAYGLQVTSELLACGAYVTSVMALAVLRIIGALQFILTPTYHPGAPLAFKVWRKFMAEPHTKEVGREPCYVNTHCTCPACTCAPSQLHLHTCV